MIRNRRAQTTLEYALLIAVVIAALIAMQQYMRKGMMGKLKESSDDIGKQFDPDNGYTIAWQTTSTGTQSTTTEVRGAGASGTMQPTVTTVTVGETSTRNEHETFGTAAPAQHF